jgi:hypothetical protein
MATFPVNPLAFLPEGMTIDHGPADRKVRTDLVVSPNAPLHNDKVVIAETNRFIPIHLRQAMRDDLRNLLEEGGHSVSAYDDHPFGLGSFTFLHSLNADTVIGQSFEIDDITTVTFVRHNEAKNMRITSFGRSIWLLLLGFPLDYQTTSYISSAVEDFGLLVVWDNPRGNNKFVLVKVHIVHPKFVPKSIVMHELGGSRFSWTVPVIMLRSSDWNAHVHDIPPPPEDPPSDDPHPLYGEDYTAEQLFQQQLAAWLQQNQHQGGQQLHQGGNNVQQHAIQLLPPAQIDFQIPAPVVHDAGEIVPPNLNPLTLVQGVPFHAGFHPSNADLPDSPMQAYNDNVSDNDSDLMVQIIQIEDSHSAANAFMLARFTLAKSAISYCLKPHLAGDNGFFFDTPIQFEASDMFELFGEKMVYYQNKKRNGSSQISIVEISSDENSASTVAQPQAVGQKRKKTVLPAPICTTQVRRSTRCNKYDGFKPKNFSDSKATKSKVKPRKVTTAINLVPTDEDDAADPLLLDNGTNVPDFTPIPVLHAIGVNLCGVPPEEISPQKLMEIVPEDEDEKED